MSPRPRTPLLLAGLLWLTLLLPACGGGSDGTKPSPVASTPSVAAATATPGPELGGLIGKPQNRTGFGDTEAAFSRYAVRLAPLIELIKAQAWYQDGLTRDEALFVERLLTF